MGSENDEGHWVEETILPELKAPPPELIQVRGAQLVRVKSIDPPGVERGFREAVVLAWARIPGGGWAGLFAWIGAWQRGHRTTGGPRWAWCQVPEGRVEPVTPPRPLVEAEDHEWHGYHEMSDLAEAVRRAAETLPEHLREAAVTPKPADE